MKRALIPTLPLLLALVPLGACGPREQAPLAIRPPARSEAAAPAAAAAAAATSSTAATAATEPVDWCGAHGVPESVCTRCNPKLIAEFQARGDWCKEHGVPESQCTICHPELIEKFRKMAPRTGALATTDTAAAPSPPSPPPPAVADWCGAHAVPESVCTRCNPKLIPEFQARGDWCKEHGLPESQCTICHPELIEKFRKMAPRPAMTGAIEELPAARAYAGIRVRLATPETASKAGIRTDTAKESAVVTTVEAPARLVFDARRSARISAPASGVVREVLVTDGDRVKAHAVAVVLASPELAQAAARLRDAEAALALARQTVEREEQLVARQVSARRDLLEAERQHVAAQAAAAGARGVLRSLGDGDGDLDGLDAAGGRLLLRTPRAGIVTRVGASVGQAVGPDAVLIEVNDPAHLWAEMDLPEAGALEVRPGDRVTLAFAALPGREVEGKIAWVAAELEPRTRTVHARAEVANDDLVLRAGMFGRARVELEAHRGVTVPGEAVQDAPEGPVAFVQLDPQVYEPRALRLGRARAGDVEVLAGLRPGERVVTQGSFLLKTEIMKGSLGAGCCDAAGK